MADKWSNDAAFIPGGAFVGTEKLVGLDGTANKKWLASQLATYISASPALTGTPTAPTPSAANNSTRIATTAFVAGEISTAVTGLLDFKGNTDCSTNPNYPAASKGDAYIVTVAGKIGGASGASVDVGDVFFARADNAGGTQASVGTSWSILEHNLAGALLSANNLSDIANAATALGNLSGQPLNSNLTAIAALAPANDDIIQRKAGAWTNRTMAQLVTDLALGSIATQSASAVAITGGSLAGITSLALTPAANASPITLTGYSLTGSAANSLVSWTGTLNTSGSPDVIQLNITNTGSGASTNLCNFKVGGSSVFAVSPVGTITVTSSADIVWAGRLLLRGAGGGIAMISNSGASDFNRLQFGGISSSFPSLKRNTTTLQVRLADDSAFTALQGKLTTDTNAAALAPPTTTHVLTLYDATGTAYRVPCLI